MEFLFFFFSSNFEEVGTSAVQGPTGYHVLCCEVSVTISQSETPCWIRTVVYLVLTCERGGLIEKAFSKGCRPDRKTQCQA